MRTVDRSQLTAWVGAMLQQPTCINIVKSTTKGRILRDEIAKLVNNHKDASMLKAGSALAWYLGYTIIEENK